MSKKNTEVVIGYRKYICCNLIPVMEFLKIIDDRLNPIIIKNNWRSMKYPKQLCSWVPGKAKLNFKQWCNKYKDYCIYTNHLMHHLHNEELPKSKPFGECIFIPLSMLNWDDLLGYRKTIEEYLNRVFLNQFNVKSTTNYVDYSEFFKDFKDSLNDLYIKNNADKTFII
jgi:hypothetical protein